MYRILSQNFFVYEITRDETLRFTFFVVIKVKNFLFMKLLGTRFLGFTFFVVIEVKNSVT